MGGTTGAGVGHGQGGGYAVGDRNLKDPDAVLDYSIEWSKWLASDQITASAWLVSDPALEAAGEANTPTLTTIWLSGGIADESYTATNRITTSVGRMD